MKTIINSILVVVAGFAACYVGVSLVSYVTSFVYPLPEGFGTASRQELVSLVDQIPFIAKLLGELAYIVGSVLGGYTIGCLANSHSYVCAVILGIILTFVNVLNLITIPHPLWIAILTMVTFIPMSLFGCLLAQTGNLRQRAG